MTKEGAAQHATPTPSTSSRPMRGRISEPLGVGDSGIPLGVRTSFWANKAISGPCRTGFKIGYSAVGAHASAASLSLKRASPYIIRESSWPDRHTEPVRIVQDRIGHDGGQTVSRRLGRFVERPCDAERVRLFKIKGGGADSAMITLLGMITLMGMITLVGRRRSGMITFIRAMITLMITFI
ncbi:MAG: hypothetical protein ACLPOA_15245 [Methylocella sp.]